MASLTHVCMWADNGWKHITAEEAARLHPEGTISAHSGLFMCELCGQYVLLTDGEKYRRYFKHSSAEKSKDCPERLSGNAACSYSYDPKKHNRPLRITDVSPSSFCFELGLVRVEDNLLDKDFRIEIQPQDSSAIPYVFTRERLNFEGTTYLPIGEKPYEKYILSYANGSDRLTDIWPTEVTGIDPQGTLFEKSSGRMLTYDSDVEIEKEYYLLIKDHSYVGVYNSIQVQEVTRKHFNWETWTLFQITASEFSEESAKFFLEYHCRLTEHPVSIKPIWPLFVERDYILKHSQDSMYMLVEGNAGPIKTFPLASLSQSKAINKHLTLYEVQCATRQQLISAGRLQPLQYTYLWHEPLDESRKFPSISVTDLSEQEIPSGETNILPHNNTLIFKSEYDGELVITNNGVVIDKRRLKADNLIEIDKLSYGIAVQIVIGLDIVWEIKFNKQYLLTENDETEILEQIKNASGMLIPTPHSLKNIQLGLRHYPQISQWIRKCIQEGTIREYSFRILQDFYLKIKRQGGKS